MIARATLLLLLLVSGVAAVACGGSSSETPPPLPPHPLNEPYRVREAIHARSSEADAPAALPAERPDPIGPSSTSSSAPSTWGSSVPEPLPELAPR